MVLGFLAVFIGGLALNLTPCVYPLIGVDDRVLRQPGRQPARVMSLAILFVLGIAIRSRRLASPPRYRADCSAPPMQNRYVLIALATMLFALAASSSACFR